MRIAARNRGFAKSLRKIASHSIGFLQHLPVQRFNPVKTPREQLEITLRPRSGKTRIEMIYGYKQPSLISVSQQTFNVMTAALQFDVIFFLDAVYAGVHLCAAGQGAGDFFAEKKIRVLAQFFDRLNGIMVGYCYQIHAPGFQSFVESAGVVPGFPANAGESGYGAHTRMDGVDV
jgi:hypothetical protein